MLNQMLVGLDYAHEVENPDAPGQPLGIVHRDISPPNVLLSWNGEVKITDFGLAKATTQLESTDAGVVKGKFAYLSPEAARGQEVDRRTDIFAVGILAWEMLTGRRLFLGESDWETVEKVRAAQIPSIRQYNKSVPTELEQVIGRALAGDPDQRYRTCAEFADDLLGVLFGMGQRVSARDLQHMLEGMREEHSDPQQKAVASGAGLIAELLADEVANFRSIGEDGRESGELAEALGSQPLTQLPGYDPSAPLVDTFDDLPPPTTDPEPVPEETPARPSIPAGGPSPAPKGGSGGMIAAVFLLLVLGGAGAYWFLFLK
jgi:serine/threonine-protein kinase